MRIVIVLKGTLSVHALNYVTSLVILRLAYEGWEAILQTVCSEYLT